MHGQGERFDQFRRLGVGIGPLRQAVGQVPPGGVFERVEGAAVMLADRVDRDHIRMLEPGDRLGFGKKAIELSWREVLGPVRPS